MARRIRGALQAQRPTVDFERFRSGVTGDLPAAGGGGVILAACNDYYFWHFAITLVLSIEQQGERQKVHLHLCEPGPETLKTIDRLGKRLSNVALSWTTDDCRLAEGLQHRTVYFASSRFLLAPLILEKTQSPLLCIDVDGIAVRPVWQHYEIVRQATDLVLIQRPEETKPTMKILASALGINPTPRGIKFARDLAHSLAAILAIEPSYHIDQIGIHYLLRALSPENAPVVAAMPKALWDHDFGEESAIWTAKGWTGKDSEKYQSTCKEIMQAFPDLSKT